MNKTIGVTSLGVAVLAGMMFQTRTAVRTSMEQNETFAPALATASVKRSASDGPWIASCSYWSAAQANPSLSAVPTGPDVTIAQSEGVELHLKPADDTNECESNHPWGVPSSGSVDVQISVVVATVPDPIHSHFALEFDRSIDAMLLAAADNHYLGSYYWLPWRSQMGAPGEPPSQLAKPDPADSARERQPGLIILRYAPTTDETEQVPNGGLSNDYGRVIYLFLVAETPALGINGNQLQNAFSYEKTLQGLSASQHSASSDTSKDDSCRHSGDRFFIIGPHFSGSAASLHAGIKTFHHTLNSSCIFIAGITGTSLAAQELNDSTEQATYRSFGENVSFEQERFLQSLAATGYDLSRVAVLSEAGTVFGGAATPTPKNPESAAEKVEPAAENSRPTKPPPKFRSSDVTLKDEGTVLNLRFPRELSLLRNAEATQSTETASAPAPTPYLNLSLKDYSADDTVPRFSTSQSPLSIEAQLMAIAHQLQRARSQFILISASNVLDDLFLAQFLHRACPDARLVILSGGDLLFERDTDNAPYIGSISISPYLLTSLDFGSHVQWLHSDYESEGIYNAASFTFRNFDSPASPAPILAGYRNYPVPDPWKDLWKPDSPLPPVQFQQIPLWATAMGTDGYYPLAILSWCASNTPVILPTITLKDSKLHNEECVESKATDPITNISAQNVWKYVPESINKNSGILPSLFWGVIAGLISIACIGHCVLLWSADFWSPLTRDLAIDRNDLPHRRAIHINIGTAVLAAMDFVTGYPLFRVGHYFHLSPGGYWVVTLLFLPGIMAVVLTVTRTWRYRSHPQQSLYGVLNFVAAAALVGTITFWTLICISDTRNGNYTYAGLYFCYRCLRPLNGVSPLPPILLLLFAWYLWSIYSTARLRFSEIHRARLPRLPDSFSPYVPSNNPYPLFVPDNTLESCSRFSDNCLYKNITCLLITREVLLRLCMKLQSEGTKGIRTLAAWVEKHVNIALGVVYFILFCLCLFISHIHALDDFLFWHIPILQSFRGPTLYEFLVAALFFPLIMVVLSGWLRVILIWGAISRGLLEPLERMPLRFAFSRFHAGGWFSMLRQKGLHIRWRDMARSTESIRQIIHHPALSKSTALHANLLTEYEVINVRTHALIKKIQTGGRSVAAAYPVPETGCPLFRQPVEAAMEHAAKLDKPCPSDCLWDLPDDPTELCYIYHIEQSYARFCTILIQDYLEAFWEKERIGMVEDVASENEKSGDAKSSEPAAPTFTQLAEELIVIRYVALIRAVLVNIRYLMLFVSTAFVLALVGWNSYPFQPRAFIDWCFTFLLAVLTFGFVVVFAQMHRNAILSRITDTTVNELGWEFYLRLITFGAVPVLTWLASQFPQIGGILFRIIQPGLQVVK